MHFLIILVLLLVAFWLILPLLPVLFWAVVLFIAAIWQVFSSVFFFL